MNVINLEQKIDQVKKELEKIKSMKVKGNVREVSVSNIKSFISKDRQRLKRGLTQ